MALKLNNALGVLKRIDVDKVFGKVASVSDAILKRDNNPPQEDDEKGEVSLRLTLLIRLIVILKHCRYLHPLL